MINAAGVLFLAGEDPRNLLALLVRRTAEGDHEGEWSIPGGKIEEGETAEEAATRECEEELGLVDFPNDLELHTRRIYDGVDYTTFSCRVPEPFDVTLNEEHDAFEWISVGSISGVEEGRSDAEFNEADHPRDSDGKFGSGGGKKSWPGHSDLGVYNSADKPDGFTAIKEFPFVGDTEVGRVLDIAKEKAPDWKYDLEPTENKTVSQDEIVSMQPWTDDATVEKYQKDYGEKNPLALHHDGRYYLVNGTHRAIARIRNGQNEIPLRVVDLDRTGRSDGSVDAAEFVPRNVRVERSETVQNGEAAGYYDPATKTIYLATHLRLGDGLRELSNPARLEAHEAGHAVDHSLGWVSHDEAFVALLEPVRDVLEPEEVIGADYYLGNPEEAFAEAYAYLRGPAEGAMYFGTLEPDRVKETVGEIIEWVRNRISSDFTSNHPAG